MSTNCLVTKLKGSVDNNELVKVNEIKVKFQSETSFLRCNFFVDPGSGTVTYTPTIRIAEGTAKDANNNPVIDGNCPLGVNIYGDGIVALSDKYQMISLTEHNIEGTPSDYAYMTNLLELAVGRSGSCKSLTKLHLYSFTGASDSTDVLDGLSGSYNSLKILYYITNSELDIDTTKLGKFTSLIRLVLNYNNRFPLPIELFVQNQRANGRTSGTVEFSGSVTFDSEFIPSNTNEDIVWTDTTITFKGKTINA